MPNRQVVLLEDIFTTNFYTEAPVNWYLPNKFYIHFYNFGRIFADVKQLDFKQLTFIFKVSGKWLSFFL